MKPSSPYLQSFLIEGKFLGQAVRDPQFVQGQLAVPRSGLWYCGFCGEVYAKTPVTDICSGMVTGWQAFTGCCRKCYGKSTSMFWAIPGSIWLNWDSGYVDSLPAELLARELLLHLDHYERVHNG